MQGLARRALLASSAGWVGGRTRRPDYNVTKLSLRLSIWRVHPFKPRKKFIQICNYCGRDCFSFISSGIFVVDSCDNGSPLAERRIAIQRVEADCAKRIIINTVNGADKNIPGIPQIAPHMANPKSTTSADRFSVSPIIQGCTKLPIENCQKLTPAKTKIANT